MAKSSGVIYGPTGSFKTTAIGHMARYIGEKTGKSTLLLSADGGGWGPIGEEVKAGLVRPFRMDTATIPLSMLRRVSRGYWPENPEEPDVSKMNFVPINWDEVGAVAIEGFTSIGTMLMRHVADRNINTGQDATSPFSQRIRVEGVVVDEVFAGNSKAHYNFVQNQLYGTTMNFISWPVEYVLFTGHEKKAEDDDKTTLYGVAVPGKAITPLIPTWVGDCIHAQDYSVKRMERGPKIDGKPGEMEDVEVYDIVCRYYFKKHPDPVTGIMFPAKPRVTHGAVAALSKRFPAGFFVPTPERGFDMYLRALDELTEQYGSDDSLRGWRERAAEKLGRGQKTSAVPTQPLVGSTK